VRIVCAHARAARAGRTVIASLVLLAAAASAGHAQAPADIQRVVDEAYRQFKDLNEGKNADYIPALAKVPSDLFGIAVITPDGRVYAAGDTSSLVSIQSISKVFTMARVMEDEGRDTLSASMGVDATGQPFNSIVAIEQYKGHEMNPLVNPGAIATTSKVRGSTADEVWKNILRTYEDFAGRQLTVLEDIYRSEAATNQRNQAIGALMFAYGIIDGSHELATDIYTRQCSVGVNARDLATMAATLANGGRNPVTGKQVVKAENVPAILSVMATAGLYDDSGKWLYATGLPAKSGVGGGLIAVSPGRFGIAAISPPLDGAGNSVRAQKAIAYISNELGGNPFASRPAGLAANGRQPN
jgi:glutaminase